MTHYLLLVCIALVVAGVWFVFWPAAFITGGVLLAPWFLFRPLSEVEDDVST